MADFDARLERIENKIDGLGNKWDEKCTKCNGDIHSRITTIEVSQARIGERVDSRSRLGGALRDAGLAFCGAAMIALWQWLIK